MDNIKILLAEDNILNRKVILAMLDKMGYKADSVSSGHGVIEALEKEFYNVIFMDIYMPGMTGIETTKYVRKNFQKERQPFIIAMTGGALKGDRDNCYSAGMNDYIDKPVSKEKLYDILKKCKEGTVRYDRPLSFSEETDKEIFNKIEIMKRLSGDKKLIHDIINLFISHGPLQFDKLEEAFRGNNRENLKLIAHTIKGSARNVSAMYVASIAFEIEKKSKEGDLEEISLLIKKLYDSYYEFKEFVSKDFLSDENL
jgi:CheY-like chemotaxis protein